MLVNLADLRNFPGRSGSRRRSRTQPNLDDLQFHGLRLTVCSSYPHRLLLLSSRLLLLSSLLSSERILVCLAEPERRPDSLVIEGTGHGGVGAVIGLSNARVARLCGAPVLGVCKGGIGSAVDAVTLNLALYEKEGAAVASCSPTSSSPTSASSRSPTSAAFAGQDLTVVGGLDWSPVLANRTLAQIARALGSKLHRASTSNRPSSWKLRCRLSRPVKPRSASSSSAGWPSTCRTSAESASTSGATRATRATPLSA